MKKKPKKKPFGDFTIINHGPCEGWSVVRNLTPEEEKRILDKLKDELKNVM